MPDYKDQIIENLQRGRGIKAHCRDAERYYP